MRRGIKPKLYPEMEWFTWHMASQAKIQREETEEAGLKEMDLSHSFYLDQLYRNVGNLAAVCNESKLRSEIVIQAAWCANLCRLIAEKEKPKEGRDDLSDTREDYEDDLPPLP